MEAAGAGNVKEDAVSVLDESRQEVKQRLGALKKVK